MDQLGVTIRRVLDPTEILLDDFGEDSLAAANDYELKGRSGVFRLTRKELER